MRDPQLTLGCLEGRGGMYDLRPDKGAGVRGRVSRAASLSPCSDSINSALACSLLPSSPLPPKSLTESYGGHDCEIWGCGELWQPRGEGALGA